MSPQKAGTAKKRNVLILIGLVVLVGAQFVFIQLSKPESKTVTGVFSLYDDGIGTDCEGTGGYSDIGASTGVVVTGKDGKEYDPTRLGTGVYGYNFCMYTFKLKVEKGQDYYIVSVGRRGDMDHSWEELEDISITLGS